jgi:replicative DNA helicase
MDDYPPEYGPPITGKGKQPLPQNTDAEASLLGAILIDVDALFKISDAVTAEDFFDERHKQIYIAITQLYEKRSAIDVLTLSDQLKANGYLENIGGAAYLTELTNYVPTAAHVENYADIVAQKATRRRLIGASQEISDLGYDETKSLKELVEAAEARLFEVGNQQIKQTVTSIETVLAESFERLDDLHKDKGKLRGVPTGYQDMDDMLAGLQRGDLFILAARPAMGKTAFVLNLARNVAQIGKVPVLIFSLEMGKEQLVDRLLAMESGVDSWALRTGNLTDSDFEKLGHAMGALSEAKLLFDDTPSITVNDLRTKARREAHNEPLGLIIVDYLQLMSGGSRFSKSDNRVQEITEISRGLKQVARELKVPLIALSQLSRSVESRSPQIPQLSDLRESGSIEQDADIVAFLYREDYYNPETDRQNVLDVLIKKHRSGPVGGVSLYFDRERQKISSLDTKHGDVTPFDE